MPESIDRYHELLRRHLPDLSVRHHVAELGLFGSRVRGEARADSDLDVLVTFDRVPTLLQFIALEQELSDLLGIKVDLVMRDSLRPEVGQRVSREVVPV